MAIAVMVDNPQGSVEIYEKVRQQAGIDGDSRPEGAIAHFAGPSPKGGWRVITVWESQEDADRFMQERLRPAFEAVGAPPAPEPEIWSLHNYMV